MSHLVQTDTGDIIALDILRLAWNSSPKVRIHLVKAAWTPSESTVVGDLLEANFPGYAYRVAAGWTAPVTVGARAQTAADPCVWTRSTTGAAQTIYGYWAESQDNLGDVFWSEKFDTPVVLTNAGETLVLYPQYTFDSEFSS